MKTGTKKPGTAGKDSKDIKTNLQSAAPTDKGNKKERSCLMKKWNLQSRQEKQKQKGIRRIVG